MKPTHTCHIVRQLSKELGSSQKIDSLGLPADDIPLPDFSVGANTDIVRHEWLAYNLLRKREVERPETEIAARQLFQQAEAACATFEREGFKLSHDDLKTLIVAKQICYDVLGDSPPSDWTRDCSFSGGASTSRCRSESHPALKWVASPPLDVTPLAYEHLLRFKQSCEVIDIAWSNPGILSHDSYPKTRDGIRIVPGSRLSFVEKNFKTKRTILIEPDGNMLLQKGIGSNIRRLLRKVGINLNSQTRNQWLAKIGSITGTLGTIDLSMASDTVTLLILRYLLPWDWYSLIYELRSPVYQDGDNWYKMHKVSSMGNGFTFELESLVFYCLTKAVVDRMRPSDRRIGIFGDDIIVATECCDTLVAFMSKVGFSVNTEKSFWKGGFRESCGKHYHNGGDVTPVYIKADLDCISEKFRLYNLIRSWAGGIHYDPRYTSLLGVIIDSIPVGDRRQVPVEYGPNAGIWFSDVCQKPIIVKRSRNQHDRLKFFVYAEVFSDITNRLEPEVAWLYRHVERWSASCPLGIYGEYTPFKLERATGARAWSERIIPFQSVVSAA